MPILYLETGSTDPYYNLAFEEFVLCRKTSGARLMLWQNDNTVVIGLNQNPAEEIDRDFVQSHGIRLVRRMTGGGAVFHDLGNLNYSFITDLDDPADLSISSFTAPICRALEGMGLHARCSGRNDICIDGKKVSGVAQRIMGRRILHHGTLLFDSDPSLISGALRADPSKFRSKSAKSVRSRVGNIRPMLPLDMDMAEFKSRLLAALSEDGLVTDTLSAAELSEIEKLAQEKYRSWDWNYGRCPEFEYSNKARFPGGSMELSMSVERGIIRQIRFDGDYMARTDNEAAVKALTGLRLEREELCRALSGLDTGNMFGGIGIEEILSLIMGGTEK